MSIFGLGIMLLILILLILGIIVAVIKFKSSKKDEGYSALLFSYGMMLIMSASSSTTDKILVAIGVITKYENAQSLEGSFNFWYFGLGIALISISVLIYLNSKKKLYILNINAYIPMRIEDFFKGMKMSNFEFKEREIDLIKIYKRIFSKRLDDESFECIKDEIEQKVEAFKNETSDIKRGYTGIAPIPFIIYAGTFLERIQIKNYYEFDKIATQSYYKLREDKKIKFPQLKINTDIDNLNKLNTEVVLSISLTQFITREDLCQFLNLDIVEMGTGMTKDNIIIGKEQLFQYNNLIFETIEKLGKKLPKLKTIHIVYSGQSCLALEMGKRSIDSTRLPQIISYQFEIQSEIKYPWGIVINGADKGKLIRA